MGILVSLIHAYVLLIVVAPSRWVRLVAFAFTVKLFLNVLMCCSTHRPNRSTTKPGIILAISN